jgi:hypothetical protein
MDFLVAGFSAVFQNFEAAVAHRRESAAEFSSGLFFVSTS